MTPGALTPAERVAIVDHWHWCARNPRMPEDPDLRFTGDLLRRRPAAGRVSSEVIPLGRTA